MQGAEHPGQWVLIAPEAAIDPPKTPDSEPVFTKLRNPSTGKFWNCDTSQLIFWLICSTTERFIFCKAEIMMIVQVLCAKDTAGEATLYLFNSGAQQLFEVKAFHEECRSWFIGQTVQQDGRLLFVTPMDPLFLILYYLIKADKEQQGKFQPLDQVVLDPEYPSCPLLLKCENVKQYIQHVTEEKGEKRGRQVFTQQRVQAMGYQLLQENAVGDSVKCFTKVQVDNIHRLFLIYQVSHFVIEGDQVNQTVKALKSNNISVGERVLASTFINNKQITDTKEDYVRYAHGLISEYIPEDLSKELLKYLGLPELRSPAPEPPLKKKKLSDVPVEPEEDYTKLNSNNLKTKKANTKMSAAQKALAKVDKSGMKSISTFFSSKPKASK
ncbi:Ribonuclease H2 subunit B [Pitangus sulphuratus]|nr:Ribonuclease H2 subunit B [Pitangus sulphuratus]